jgi:cytochrome c oxidase subunit IV
MAEHVSHSHQAEAPEHHGSGAYWLVWIALLVLTGITWWTGQMHLAGFALLLALIIAVTKATLVVLFFMHLWEQKGVNRVALASSIVFVVVMLLGVFGDVTMRLNTLLPNREDPLAALPQDGHGAGGQQGSGGANQTAH